MIACDLAFFSVLVGSARNVHRFNSLFPVEKLLPETIACSTSSAVVVADLVPYRIKVACQGD
jgi:hypothetical protein